MYTITPRPDAVSNIKQSTRQSLDAIFKPKNVALIGATEKEGSVGRTILWNLLSSPFGGTIFPINPKRSSVLGIKTYPNITAISEKIDLAIIVIPAPGVPAVIKECIDVGVKGAIIISAGFKEIGAPGLELERQILEQAHQGGMRIIGPNCLGVMSPITGLNATFASKMAHPGNVGFISQSGALCTAILDWSFRENVGFSAFVSIGSMLDVGWGDLIYYLGNDPNTKSIVIYMESIGNARSFLSAAREVALTKPIIVIKVGHTEAAAKAAASHTGALTGSDGVLDAAFRRTGVLRVNNISYLFFMAEVLAKQPRPQGPRLTIVTNAGGPGVIATDALITEGGELAEISPETIAKLNQFLPTHWSHSNPVDILGDAEPIRYAKTLEVVANDPESDGLLVILTPQAMSDPTATAEQIKNYAQVKGKPILASWMGGEDVAAGADILNHAGIPAFPYPDTAARLFYYMWRYTYNLRGLYETPTLPKDVDDDTPPRAIAEKIIKAARDAGRTLLTEFESKQLFAAYGIPVVETRLATSSSEAVKHAQEIGYPIVLKLYSETITHKTDVGGVKLNLIDADGVAEAYRAIETSVTEKVGAEHFLGVTVQKMIKLEGYELILGSSIDPQFGPVLLFGTGGQLVEVFKDRSLALPPLNTTLARRMMEQTKIYHALKGVRGRLPVDLEALELLLVRFSQLVIEQRWIKETDINPLLASPEQLVALDARVVLHDLDLTENQLPTPAVRPYPSQHISTFVMEDHTEVTIRPIRPEDEPLLVKLHENLSDRSVYFRYFHEMDFAHRVAHERLTRICFIDYDREMALVVDYKDPQTGEHQVIGFGSLSKLQGNNEGECSVIVRDSFQRRGLGTEILRQILDIGHVEKLSRITAYMLTENIEMQKLCKKFDFQLTSIDQNLIKAEIELG